MTIPLQRFIPLLVLGLWCHTAFGQVLNTGACWIRPTGCILNCASGFSWGFGGHCLCLCYVNPCTNYPCLPGQVCVVKSGFPQCINGAVSGIEVPRTTPLISHHHQTNLIGECPLLRGGDCSQNCKTDHDCPNDFKCCHNGCGMECVQPVEVAPVKAALPILPISGSSKSTKVSSKWCDHFAKYVNKLPNKYLNNGHVPDCNVNGDFEAVQCDTQSCWCVDVFSGIELLGTKQNKYKRNEMNCQDNTRCEQLCEDQSCLYGLETDFRGCPVAGCKCKNICDGVRCQDSVSECQLKESKCKNCPPVPICLINPCPHGLRKLEKGVTALCITDKHCGKGFWCNPVGFGGNGFCCSDPESARRSGECKNVGIQETRCKSECKADSDCADAEKCCFSGCGLKCTSHFNNNAVQVRTHKKHDNKYLFINLSQCPLPSKERSSTVCSTECETDNDCKGMKRCCVDGCSKKCTYPSKTTSCLHSAITSELFSTIILPECSIDGYFQPIQCNRNFCYCVNRVTGIAVPGTLVPKNRTPNCNRPRSCVRQECDCQFGSELDEDGCETCECINPCKDVVCPIGNVCIMADVECLSSSCLQQPRCVPNVCSGKPEISIEGFVKSCNRECSSGYTCNNVGFPGQGGICCSERNQPVKRFGKCLKESVDLSPYSHCHVECRSDDECKLNQKCCFTGCGLKCREVDQGQMLTPEVSKSHVVPSETSQNHVLFPVPSTVRSGVVVTSKLASKVGRCGKPSDSAQCRSGHDECKVDPDCGGIQKCCNDGCYKKCLYPEVTTACLHLRTAFERLGKDDTVRCNEDGSFKTMNCDENGCYCVDSHGQEVSGTRVEAGTKPTCVSRICPANDCLKSCAHGYVKDKNGCNTCECIDICRGIKCPNEFVCVSEPVECIGDTCVDVPKCVPNVCSTTPVKSRQSGMVARCHSDSECPLQSTCRTFGLLSGVCCSGKHNHQHPGACPKPSSQNPNCKQECKDDDDCGTSKCCYNGCGTECMAVTQTQSRGREKTLTLRSECPTVQDLGVLVCGRERENKCDGDDSCSSGLSCCFDGCVKSCVNLYRTTQCLHQQSAIQALIQFGNVHLKLPLCELNGAFSQIQRHGELQWCVTSDGNELPGTRSNSGSTDCTRPRICPTTVCPLSCDFGYKLDRDGCEVCECHDPCRNVECPLHHVCRSVRSECTDSVKCGYVPKCIPNVCPRGDPLTKGSGSKLLECSDKDGKCPPGWSCHHFGFEKRSYCCAGIGMFNTRQCPDVFSSFSKSQKTRNVECKGECSSKRPCCFDGYGVRCQEDTIENGRIINKNESSVTASVALSQNQLGSCPANRFHNPGCQQECFKDSDCPDLQLCCGFGCGKRCLFPDITHNCVHRMAVLAEEIIKYASLGPLVSRITFDEDQFTKCSSNGDFKEIQCDKRIRQCWCVDKITGSEVVGTRSQVDARGEPNCQKPRKCSTKCDAEDFGCDHGIRLDSSGCPLNQKCECQNPCEHFHCAVPNEICVLKRTKCLNQEQCVTQPTCRPSTCPGHLNPMKDSLGIVKNCRSEKDCGKRGECRSMATTDDPEGHRVGICCGMEEDSVVIAARPSLQSVSKGVCPPQDVQLREDKCEQHCNIDHDCEGNKLCCSYGCSSRCISGVAATRCHNLYNAIQKLLSNNIRTTLSSPLCESESGRFMKTQCDDKGYCWCVDKENGIELVGTRQFQPSTDACSGPRRDCIIQCSLDEVNNCPMGLDLNSEGCPKTSQCKCYNPCNQVECPESEVCILRQKECDDDVCLPVPVCEPSPCKSGYPLKDASTNTHFSCFNNVSKPCPPSYQCSGLDKHSIGVCCPASDPTLLKAFGDVSCLHGTPFIARERPTVCSLKEASTCPLTHYCVSSDEQHGICCPTKRFVCNLELDIGGCNNPTERYYFDSDNQVCKKFVYSGCDGNLNNFESEKECRDYCRGLRMDEALDDTGMQYYQIGFTFTGPLMRQRHTEDFTNKLKDYIRDTFNVEGDDIRDLLVQDDNSVRFNLVAQDAQKKADFISKAIESGQLYFRYGDQTYHAEPTTLFSRLVDSNSSRLNGPLYWYVCAIPIEACEQCDKRIITERVRPN
ncbi:unnamed protein product [Bursaphelenchus okinawaensis]|uniref:Uncharacterized protein n=1 Tax=Bursaphelenchus okinawaensis TaxID=465554 RepID=A0A811KRA6_9BILA|nr:unnamed protein product [Bursaphelenchus okinawaensis]CAG9112302.1 unnamed protein product [Bursaphelenchus okinawaensis]